MEQDLKEPFYFGSARCFLEYYLAEHRLTFEDEVSKTKSRQQSDALLLHIVYFINIGNAK